MLRTVAKAVILHKAETDVCPLDCLQCSSYTAYRIHLHVLFALRWDALSGHCPGPTSWVDIFDCLDSMRPCQLQKKTMINC